MKDLDFDELDRAVNSLMTNVPKSAPQVGEEKEKTLDITPTLGEDTTPPLDRLQELAAQVTDDPDGNGKTSPSPVAPTVMPASVSPRPSVSLAQTTSPRPQTTPAVPATRRGGRFMDVVHPSSDMKKTEMTPPVSRQGVTVEPRSMSAAAAPQPTTPAVPVKDEVVALPSKPVSDQDQGADTPAQTHESPAPASDWPDPLDVAMKTSNPKAEDDLQPVTPPVSAPASEEPLVEDAAAPLTSPFLPDAKVEKRPLGSPDSSTESTDIVATPGSNLGTESANDQLPATPGMVEPQLPEELQNDLIAVEADTTHDALKKEHEMQPADNGAVASTPKPDAVSTDTPAPSGPTSIPQQYREEPSTGDQKSGSIYDVEDYHQPLAHPGKKKSGWMWVLWIAIILLVGAGAGAALYYMKLV